MSDYDVIVIGGGSPGEHCAGALAEGGLRGAPVERELVGASVLTGLVFRRRRCCDRAKPSMLPEKLERQPKLTSARCSLGEISWFQTTPTPVRSAGSPNTASTFFAVMVVW